MKMCYNNVFNIASDFRYFNKFETGEWKVAYGYYSIFGNFYARHCFIVTDNNEVIDATIFTQSEEKERDYISFKIFDNFSTYTEALWEGNREPALYRLLVEDEKNAHTWAIDNCIVLMG